MIRAAKIAGIVVVVLFAIYGFVALFGSLLLGGVQCLGPNGG